MWPADPIMVGAKELKSFSSFIVWTPPPPLLYKGGGIDFLKFGIKGGDKIFFLEREELD